MDLAGVPWSEIGQTWLTELMNEETFTCGEEKLPEHQQTRAEAPRDRPPNAAGRVGGRGERRQTRLEFNAPPHE